MKPNVIYILLGLLFLVNICAIFRTAWRKNCTTNLMGGTSFACPDLNGRLGNQMYQYASLYAISKLNNLTLLLGENDFITLYFKVPSARVIWDRDICATFKPISSKYCCRYDKSLIHLSRQNYYFTNFQQSWKYFQNFYDEIRLELSFKDYLSHKATRLIDEYRASYTRTHRSSYAVAVGVHIRRGDMAKSDNQMTDYLHRAIDFYLNKYSNVFFMVCTEEMDYAKETMCYRNVTTFFYSGTPAEDMALLTSCDHSIMTLGTFGWWSSFLAGGTVVYYKFKFTSNISVYKEEIIDFDDYFPPKWIGLE